MNTLLNLNNNDFELWNMDETPVWIDMPAKRTFELKGKQRVCQITTGSHRKKVTAVLCCSSTGKKLPPMVIADSRYLSKAAEVHGLHRNHTSMMNSRLMIECIERSFVPSLRTSLNVLILDSFRGHITPEVKDCFKRHGIYIAVIPGGCTPFLQPLDLTVNRSFKARLRQKWLGWINRDDNPVTRSGNVRSISPVKLKQFIDSSFEETPCSVIVNGFKKAGVLLSE